MFKPYFFWSSQHVSRFISCSLTGIAVTLLLSFISEFSAKETGMTLAKYIAFMGFLFSTSSKSIEGDPYYAIRIANSIVFIALIIGSIIFCQISDSLSSLFSKFILCFSAILLYMYVLLIYRKHLAIQEGLAIKPPDYLLSVEDFDELAEDKAKEERIRLFD